MLKLIGKTILAISRSNILFILTYVLYVFFLQVVGSLAAQKPEEGQQISGILIKRNFNYHIISPKDLSSKFFMGESFQD